jgi:hypothetical protein
VGMYFRVGYMVGQAVANAVGAVSETAWRNFLHAGLVVAGAWVGQRWGLAGVSAAVVGAITINFAMVLHMVVKVTGIRWAEFAGLHMRAILLALVTGGEAWAVALALRPTDAPAIVTLVLSASAVVATVIGVIRFRPGLLGVDGLWIVETLYRSVPAPLRPFLRKTRVA